MKNRRHCKYCSTELKGKQKSFCSNSCTARYRGMGKLVRASPDAMAAGWTEETRRKQAELSRRRAKGQWTSGNLSREIAAKRMHDIGKKYGHINGGKGLNTRYEHLMLQKLEKFGIRYEHNTKTFLLPDGIGGCYWADFYLDKYNAILEIDGKSHRGKKARRHDIRRDGHLLETYGVRTIRIKNKDVVKLTRKKVFKELKNARPAKRDRP